METKYCRMMQFSLGSAGEIQLTLTNASEESNPDNPSLTKTEIDITTTIV